MNSPTIRIRRHYRRRGESGRKPDKDYRVRKDADLVKTDLKESEE